MCTRTPLLALGVLLLIAVATPAAAQPSLADVARQEAARRKGAGTSAKVYTNKDVNRGRPLTTAAATTNAPAPPAAAAPERAVAPDGGASEGTASAPSPTDPRLAGLQEQLASLTDAAAKALGEADKLNATIVNLFDENQRRMAIEHRDQQLTDYHLRQAQIEQVTKQIGELQNGRDVPSTAKPPQPR